MIRHQLNVIIITDTIIIIVVIAVTEVDIIIDTTMNRTIIKIIMDTAVNHNRIQHPESPNSQQRWIIIMMITERIRTRHQHRRQRMAVAIIMMHQKDNEHLDGKTTSATWFQSISCLLYFCFFFVCLFLNYYSIHEKSTINLRFSQAKSQITRTSFHFIIIITVIVTYSDEFMYLNSSFFRFAFLVAVLLLSLSSSFSFSYAL